jgi:Rrf2 family transcriptional regulator, repressor of oqxAB
VDFRAISGYGSDMIDTRFSTALQIVISVAVNEESNLRSTSQSLAERLDTNASFVRKLLIPLSEHGILAPSAGNKGGIRLGRPAGQILLSEIYAAVTADKKIWATRPDIPDQCFISGNINALSAKLCDEAEQAISQTLGNMTVEKSIAELRKLDACRRGLKAACDEALANVMQSHGQAKDQSSAE